MRRKRKDDPLYKQAQKEYFEELRGRQIKAGYDPPTDLCWCEVSLDHNEKRIADHIHHKAGRVGPLLYDKRHFMAVALPWHPDRIHRGEQHNGVRSYGPEWARAKGYLI